MARRLQRTVVPALCLVLLAGLLSLLVLLLLQARSRHDRDQDRDAALAAARTEATNLVNISYATAQRDLQRIVAGATGALRRNFLAERGRFGVLAKDKSKTTGSVLTTALVSLDRSAGVARVAVAADATISDSLNRQPSLTHYRIVLTLQHIGDRWLASDAAFVGAPQ